MINVNISDCFEYIQGNWLPDNQQGAGELQQDVQNIGVDLAGELKVERHRCELAVQSYGSGRSPIERKKGKTEPKETSILTGSQ